MEEKSYKKALDDEENKKLYEEMCVRIDEGFQTEESAWKLVRKADKTGEWKYSTQRGQHCGLAMVPVVPSQDRRQALPLATKKKDGIQMLDHRLH